MCSNDKIEQLQERVSTFPIFVGTHKQLLERVIRISEIIKYPQGAIIFAGDDISSAFFIILSGAVKIQTHRLKSFELGTGCYFGEYSLIENRPHSSTATAITDTEVLVLPSDVFNELLQQSLPFSNNLLSALVKRLRSKEQLENAMIEKNAQIKEQNEKINDSIELAGIIQKNLLPSEKLLRHKFDSYFLIFQPCQNISGDFFWFAQRYNEYCIAMADCTGHGAPAGLISIMGITYLNEIINTMQDPDPGKILSMLGNKLKQAFTCSEDRFHGQLGMDISMVTINFNKMKLRYAGANLPVFVVSNQQILELLPEKCSLNGVSNSINFKSSTIDINHNDMVYLFTDGFIDQVGGKRGKRIGISRFKEFIFDVSELNVHKQQRALLTHFNNWKGTQLQIDDVSVLGFQI